MTISAFVKGLLPKTSVLYLGARVSRGASRTFRDFRVMWDLRTPHVQRGDERVKSGSADGEKCVTLFLMAVILQQSSACIASFTHSHSQRIKATRGNRTKRRNARKKHRKRLKHGGKTVGGVSHRRQGTYTRGGQSKVRVQSRQLLGIAFADRSPHSVSQRG